MIAGILGLMVGSPVYAEMSHGLNARVLTWGNRGGIMLPDLVGLRLPCRHAGRENSAGDVHLGDSGTLIGWPVARSRLRA